MPRSLLVVVALRAPEVAVAGVEAAIHREVGLAARARMPLRKRLSVKGLERLEKGVRVVTLPIWCVPSDGGTPGLARPQPRAQHRNIALTAGLLEVLGKDGHPQIDAADGGVGAVGLVDVVGEAAGEEGGPGRRAIFEGVCAARQQGSVLLFPAARHLGTSPPQRPPPRPPELGTHTGGP